MDCVSCITYPKVFSEPNIASPELLACCVDVSKPTERGESSPKRRCVRQDSGGSDASTSTNFSDDSQCSVPELVYGIKTLRGARPSMEDVVVVQPNLTTLPDTSVQHCEPLDFFAVYDGHGGAHVAEHCAAVLHNKFVESLKRNNGQTLTVQDALSAAFLYANQTLNVTASQLSGSTAATIAVAPTKFWTAHCGDSRIVLARKGIPLSLTTDHSLERDDEARRVTRCGGQVLWKGGCGRVNGLLAMSRAIGDLSLSQYGVTAEPEVSEWDRSPDDQFLIIASDGLWSVMSNQEVVDLAAYTLQRAAAKGKPRAALARITAGVLAKMAIENGSTDNVSVIFVDLAGGPGLPEMGSGSASVEGGQQPLDAGASVSDGEQQPASQQHQQQSVQDSVVSPPGGVQEVAGFRAGAEVGALGQGRGVAAGMPGSGSLGQTSTRWLQRQQSGSAQILEAHLEQQQKLQQRGGTGAQPLVCTSPQHLQEQQQQVQLQVLKQHGSASLEGSRQLVTAATV